MRLAPIIALAAAGMAAEQSRPRFVLTKAQRARIETLAPLAKLAEGMPEACGVAEVDPELHNFHGQNFLSRWEIQRASFIAARGDAGFLVPDLDDACLVAWCDFWLLVQSKAASRDNRLKATTGAIGRARRKLLAVKARLAGAESGLAITGEPPSPFETMRALAGLCVAMDSAILTNLNLEDTSLSGFGRDFLAQVPQTFQSIGDGFGFAVESVLIPAFGAPFAATAGVIGSAIAPYLVIGGALYYVSKRPTTS